jgi:Recombination endonuclease VII
VEYESPDESLGKGKRCARCQLVLPTHSFTRDGGARDSLSLRCRKCQKEAFQQRRTTIATHKVCADCGQRKSASEFSKFSRSSDGLYSYCKFCRKVRRRKYENTPEQRQKARERAIRRRYSIEPEDHRLLLRRSSGRCDVCRELLADNTKFIHVDHDHETGRIRGILCHGCNAGIGHFREDPTFLRAAIKYLEQPR